MEENQQSCQLKLTAECLKDIKTILLTRQAQRYSIHRFSKDRSGAAQGTYVYSCIIATNLLCLAWFCLRHFISRLIKPADATEIIQIGFER